jgi:hypothetical protein
LRLESSSLVTYEEDGVADHADGGDEAARLVRLSLRRTSEILRPRPENEARREGAER